MTPLKSTKPHFRRTLPSLERRKEKRKKKGVKEKELVPTETYSYGMWKSFLSKISFAIPWCLQPPLTLIFLPFRILRFFCLSQQETKNLIQGSKWCVLVYLFVALILKPLSPDLALFFFLLHFQIYNSLMSLLNTVKTLKFSCFFIGYLKIDFSFFSFFS